ncbi:hypothetical protein [Alteromonas sp. ASW11-130]|uniref:hypothetical protein n=1 Tax=Alteromonas sp. ASW11-130 TaxID=3015775 RepID=UPI0022424535|nr:hypothetical protein [Alteromonas sp. ASW11-130]MCW8090400.1 hypothetical protein [Alteromonas sp. ASW11-130]
MSHKQRLYLYPFEHSNAFIRRTKEAFYELGYHPQSFKKLFALRNLFNRNHNAVVLNWYEDQPFRKGLNIVTRPLFIISFVLTLIGMRLFSNNVVWVRHNFKPHNVVKASILYKCVTGMLQIIANKVVTLEPTPEIKALVVKHPLYKDDAQLLSTMHASQQHDKSIDYLYFGSIKPYKRLDALLAVWPEDKALVIAGYCSDHNHAAELRQLIRARHLKVTWENAFLSDEELENTVACSRFVILPHDDNAMISSGTFYYALGLGANIICFDSAFARGKAREFPFVKIVDRQQLASQLDAVTYVGSNEVLSRAYHLYNEKAVAESWRPVLSHTRFT